jgi:multiple sugar transport system permease protein
VFSSPRTDAAHAALGYVVVGLGAFIMLMPFFYMMVFATHSNSDILSMPPPSWFGDQLMANVRDLIERRPHFWRSIGLSLWIAFAIAALNLFFCSLAGYAFAMLEFRHKELFFGFILATMLMPGFVSMIPTILLMQQLGWIDSSKALIVPGACGALGIFMMRQYISSSVPKELVDAARMDGCSEFAIYWRVILPLLGPALGTLRRRAAGAARPGRLHGAAGAALVTRHLGRDRQRLERRRGDHRNAAAGVVRHVLTPSDRWLDGRCRERLIK